MQVITHSGELSDPNAPHFPPFNSLVEQAIGDGNVERACSLRAEQIERSGVSLGDPEEDMPEEITWAATEECVDVLGGAYVPKHEDFGSYRKRIIKGIQERKARDPAFDPEWQYDEVEDIPVALEEIEEASMGYHRLRAGAAARAVGYVKLEDTGRQDGRLVFVAITQNARMIFGVGSEEAVRDHFAAANYIESQPYGEEVRFPSPWDWLWNQGWEYGIEDPEQFLAASMAGRERLTSSAAGALAVEAVTPSDHE